MSLPDKVSGALLQMKFGSDLGVREANETTLFHFG